MAAGAVPLAADFPAAGRDEWTALVRDVLRRSGAVADGPDPLAALSTLTYDAITLAPLYTARDGVPVAAQAAPGAVPFVRGSTTTVGRDVRQLIDSSDPAAAHHAALTDLESGATSLWLRVGSEGVPVTALATVLDGVYLDLAPVVLDAGADTVGAATAFLALTRDLDPAQIRGSLGADPIGLRARTGAAADPRLLATLASVSSAHVNLQVATVDASVYHDAGAGDADEIAIATAVGVDYLRALTDAGRGLDDALEAIEFRFAVSADQFAGIAKLRAARQVWDRVAQLSGAAATRRGQRQHAVTSAAMLTRRDPWVNLVRSTIACLAAAVGGAEAVTVLPWDGALGRPDERARRIARNTPAILHDEAGVGRVHDAAGGSWFVESLTAALAGRAWDGFTAIERAGGALAALDGGVLEQRIAVTRAARDADVATRRNPIIGVSEYAQPDQPLVRRAQVPVVAGAGRLPPLRWAAGFERVRDAVEARAQRPAVFLAASEPLPARVPAVVDLFHAGGFRVVVHTGDPAGVPEALGASGAAVACVCPTDGAPGEAAAASAVTLRAAGAGLVWLAAEPDPDLPADGSVDGYVHPGCNALEVLRLTASVYQVPV